MSKKVRRAIVRFCPIAQTIAAVASTIGAIIRLLKDLGCSGPVRRRGPLAGGSLLFAARAAKRYINKCDTWSQKCQCLLLHIGVLSFVLDSGTMAPTKASQCYGKTRSSSLGFRSCGGTFGDTALCHFLCPVLCPAQQPGKPHGGPIPAGGNFGSAKGAPAGGRQAGSAGVFQAAKCFPSKVLWHTTRRGVGRVSGQHGDDLNFGNDAYGQARRRCDDDRLSWMQKKLVG